MRSSKGATFSVSMRLTAADAITLAPNEQRGATLPDRL